MDEPRPPIAWRCAVSGSRTWRKKWSSTIWKDLDEQLFRLRPGDTFYLRHGDASDGADRIASEWFAARKGASHGIHMIEEKVPADWDNCVSEPYRDVTGKMIKPCPQRNSSGKPHRKPSRRSNAPDGCICPWRGHLRNPDVVVHPDYPVDCFLAFVINDSPGTIKTIEHARRYQLNRVERYFYPGRHKKAPAATRHDRDSGPGNGHGDRPGGDLHDMEPAVPERAA